MKGMVERKEITTKLLELLNFFPAVGLIGSRQVGKTTLARSLESACQRPVKYFDLERLEDYRKLHEDPGFLLEQFRERLVIIDEVQRLPGLFAELRSLIDRHRVPGRFLLLGSASPLMIRNISDSLAGRIAYLTLNPFHQKEVVPGIVEMKRHWWRGGFPDSLLAPNDDLSFQWRESFIRTYIERDLQFMGLKTDPVRFRIFLQMLAAVHGNLWNAQSLGKSLGVSSNTIKHYLHFLESSFFVHLLHPLFVNIKKRLVKSPKVYILDSGVLHALLGVRQPDELPSHPLAGASWEGYALSQIIQALPNGLEPFFYRTSDGTECDLVVAKSLRAVACIEIKFSNTPKVTKGLLNVIETMNTKHNFILTHSSYSYLLKENIRAMSLPEFVRQLPTILDS